MELTPGLLDSSGADHELRLNFTGVVAVDAIEQATGRLPARSSSTALINTSMLTGLDHMRCVRARGRNWVVSAVAEVGYAPFLQSRADLCAVSTSQPMVHDGAR